MRSAIRQAKYDRKPWIAVQLGCLLAQQMFGVRVDVRGGVEIPQPAADPVTDCDLIVPMASSGRGRAYNVPALMAYPLGHGLGIPVDEAALLRTRRGTAQAGLSGQERVINAMGLFRADADRVAGRRVLLLDDVITTGSTVSAAAQALLYAGAEWVGAVSFAVPWENQTLPAYPGIPFEGEGRASGRTPVRRKTKRSHSENGNRFAAALLRQIFLSIKEELHHEPEKTEILYCGGRCAGPGGPGLVFAGQPGGAVAQPSAEIGPDRPHRHHHHPGAGGAFQLGRGVYVLRLIPRWRRSSR